MMNWFTNLVNSLTSRSNKRPVSVGFQEQKRIESQPPLEQKQVTQVVTGDQNIILGNSKGNTFNLYGQNPLPTGEPNPFGVPYQRNRYFSGRQAVLARLHQQLHQASITAITQVGAINGLGGIGKTQTAVEYAHHHYHDHRSYDYVFWIKADTENNLAVDFANLATQLALPIASGTQDEKIPVVHQWLATHDHWLLIFDNADTPDWLPPYIPNNPQGKVLITSRASNFEQCNVASPIPLDVLSSDEAVELLLSRTGYERTPANRAAAIEINQDLAGLPLALEQASAFIVRLKIDFQTYINTYRNRGISQLEAIQAQTGEYPSSVLKTWRINFEALASEQPAASELLQLSAFLAPDQIPYRILTMGSIFMGEALASTLQSDNEDEALLAVVTLLDELSQYSLVKWEPVQRSYSVHRLVQLVIRAEMSNDTQRMWIDRSISAVAAANPGSDFQGWPICTQLLPHWLRGIDLAMGVNFESEALGAILNKTGYFLEDQGRYEEAEPLYTQALEMRQKLLGNEHPDVATSLNNLAALYDDQGRYEEAEPLYRQALKMRQKLLGNEHLEVAGSLNNLALLYRNQGRYEEAEPLYTQALEMRQKLLGNEHPDVAGSLNNLANLYYNQGRYEEAEPLYVQALEMYQKLLGNEHPSVATSLNNLAELYRNQGRYAEAEPLYTQALEMRQKLLGNEHPSVATSLNNLAALYYNQGRYEESKSYVKQALRIVEVVLGPDHPSTQTARNNLEAVP